MQENNHSTESRGFAKWIKRFGVVGFLFFFIKGLLWLIIPAVLIWFGVSC
ncbi:MAG: alanyl-tRNA synthetase [Acidobacteriota bacterium]|nr:alanyl-tRNA synthetase [Acidobacteriota bacterium]